MLPQVAHQTLFVVRVVSNDSLEGVPLDKVLKGIQAGDHVGSVIHLSHLRLEGTDDIDRALLALQAEDADLEVEPDLEDTHDAEQVEEREVQSDEDEDDGLFELPQQPATLNPVSAP